MTNGYGMYPFFTFHIFIFSYIYNKLCICMIMQSIAYLYIIECSNNSENKKMSSIQFYQKSSCMSIIFLKINIQFSAIYFCEMY